MWQAGIKCSFRRIEESSVIVDATLDVSYTEQISFVLRYVHGNEEMFGAVTSLYKSLGKSKSSFNIYNKCKFFWRLN